ncbi:AEC family transporter [Quadrisphaera sp. DSM 44207]|uniref:AEC family transporter n=1 Tax=Quadrisphaera sp. DSM 44207 TaxID=1881057 RepID=UPI0008921554|nr:AEC family transporter [Quadrisphaera sp. DSM 44207]SDQ12538.1 hypothetical protein SAMN05428996_0668 [Quadrisphaera sp. DSM 44207]
MSGVLTGFAVVIAVVAVGWLLGRTGVLGPHGQVVLARLVFYVGTPALLVRTLSTADAGAVLAAPLLVTAAAALTSAAAFALVARLGWRRSAEHVVLGSLAASYVNAANIGLPVALYVLGDPSVVAPALLFQLAVLAPAGIAVLDAVGSGSRRPRLAHLVQPLRNPLVLGSAAGIALAVSGAALPAVVADPLGLLAGTAVPCALLAFGLSLHGGARPRLASADVWLVAGLKLVVQPVVAYLVASALGLRGPALEGAVVVAALPTAQNVFVYAVRYDRAVQLARDAVLVTTVLAVPVLVVIALLLG